MVNARITILELMARYGIETYKKLSEITGYTNGSIKNWASGKVAPSTKAILRMKCTVREYYFKEVNDFPCSNPIKLKNNKL